jgi:hypothetical protein
MCALASIRPLSGVRNGRAAAPDHLWQRNNNDRQSPPDKDQDRLTLPANWGQIDAGRYIFPFLSSRCSQGIGIHVLLVAASASKADRGL